MSTQKLELSLSARKHSRLLGAYHELIIDATFTLPNSEAPKNAIPISAVAEKFLLGAPNAFSEFEQLFDSDSATREKHLIEDFRGRPPETFTDSTSSEEEVFYARGVFLRPPEDLEDDSDSEDLEEIPFSYRLSSHFETFRGTQHIVHSIVPSATGPLKTLQQIDFRDLTRVFPLRLEEIRFGVELFRSRTWSSMLGATPYIYSRFYLELRPSEIRLQAHDQIDPKSSAKCLKSQGSIELIDRTLCDNGLFEGFLSEVERTI